MDTRIGAYAVVLDGRGLLLAHWNEAGRTGWTLPGGGVDPGEDPADGVVREVREETGYDAVVDELLAVDSHVVPAERRLRRTGAPLHAVRVLYRAHVVGGELRHEVGGTTDEAAWFPLERVGGLDRVELVDLGLARAGLLAPDDDLLSLERRGWEALSAGGGAASCAQVLAPDAVVALPSGVLGRAEVLAAVAAAPPWESVAMDEVRVVGRTRDSGTVVYRVVAQRAGQEPYAAVCSSTYARRGGAWHVVLHQQTPV